MSKKVSLKSTKQEIMDALTEAERKLSEQSAIHVAPTAAMDKANEDACLKAADKDVKAGVFSAEMNNKYENLTAAIDILEKRLKTAYGVEKALADMAVVIAGQKEARLSLEDEYTRRKAELDAELETMKQNAADAKKRLDAEAKQAKADLETERKREAETYKYDLERERKAEADAHADKMKALERDAAEAQARLDAINADVEALEALRARVANIDAELESKYNAGFADGEKAAGKKYGFEKQMSEKDHGYEIKSRDEKIAALEADNKAKTEKVAALEKKLDDAYSQLRELATKTVESNGGVKVLTTGDNASGRK